MRSSVLSERERDYVYAARCIGAKDGRIMFMHVLPNTLAPLLVQLSLAMGFAVLAEAGLSFLGLGTQPPDPSWGSMLYDSRAYLREAPFSMPWLWPRRLAFGSPALIVTIAQKQEVVHDTAP